LLDGYPVDADCFLSTLRGQRLVITGRTDVHGDDMQQGFTRRHALVAGATVTAGAAVFGLDAVAMAKAPKKVRYRTKGFRRARFTPHVGAPVKLRPAGAPPSAARSSPSRISGARRRHT